MRQRPMRIVMAWAGIVFATAAWPAAAMDSSTALGAGMHAFHGGDYAGSFECLSGVIAAGSKDPRAFYFRGLAARRSGREFEAEADFLEGARLEAMGEGGRNIGRSLERVQGADRLLIECYRAKARTSLMAEGREADGRRYSKDAPEPDASIFRRRRPEFEGDENAKPATPKREALPAPRPARDTEADDEPAEAEPLMEDEKPAGKAPPAGGGNADPFGDDPFGAGEGEPAERKAGEVEAAADAADEQAEREAGGTPAAVDDFK